MSIKEHEAALLVAAFDQWAGEGPSETIDLAGDPLDWPLEERPVCYVASYYTANPAQGVANAAHWAEKLVEAGYLPLVPHFSILFDMLMPQTPEFWYALDLGLLARCDFMFVCPDYLTAHSAGVLKEIAFATEHSIPILYDVVPAVDRYL